MGVNCVLALVTLAWLGLSRSSEGVVIVTMHCYVLKVPVTILFELTAPDVL